MGITFVDIIVILPKDISLIIIILITIIIIRKKMERDYMLEEFKKVKPHTFDGEMKKSEVAEAWLLGMNKFFKGKYIYL